MNNSHLSGFQTICNLKLYATAFSSSKITKNTWPAQLNDGLLRYFDSIVNLIISILQDNPTVEFSMNKLSQNNLEGLFGSLRHGSGGFANLNVKQVQSLMHSQFAISAYRRNKNTIAPSSFETIPLNTKKKVVVLDNLMIFTNLKLTEPEKIKSMLITKKC